MNENNIDQFTTKQLVEELKKREGVGTTVIEPYKNKCVSFSGPAVVLCVID